MKCLALVTLGLALAIPLTGQQRDWPAYGGGPEDTRYSPLDQINRNNVRNLRVALELRQPRNRRSANQPDCRGGRAFFGITPTNKIFAVDAATGKELWKFDPHIPDGQPNRGLSYWASGEDRRVLVGIGHYEYGLDARSGKPVPQFGENGRIDLRKDLGRDFEHQSLNATQQPGIVVQGPDYSWYTGEPETLPAPPGDIRRAYDIRSGKLRWSFHTIPHPGEFGYDTWPKDAWSYSGGANNWAGMALDEERGIVYVPTGSASFRISTAPTASATIFFANSLIALNAETGERIWHFQSVKHDLWDRDFPAPPVLLTVKRNGKTLDAIAETTKSGFVYLFDRSNGTPLFPIEYHAYPSSTVYPASTLREMQPLPTKPASLCPADSHRRSAYEPHSGSAPGGAGTVPQIPQ